jgi:hypothetical protein
MLVTRLFLDSATESGKSSAQDRSLPHRYAAKRAALVLSFSFVRARHTIKNCFTAADMGVTSSSAGDTLWLHCQLMTRQTPKPTIACISGTQG